MRATALGQHQHQYGAVDTDNAREPARSGTSTGRPTRSVNSPIRLRLGDEHDVAATAASATTRSAVTGLDGGSPCTTTRADAASIRKGRCRYNTDATTTTASATGGRAGTRRASTTGSATTTTPAAAGEAATKGDCAAVELLPRVRLRGTSTGTTTARTASTAVSTSWGNAIVVDRAVATTAVSVGPCAEGASPSTASTTAAKKVVTRGKTRTSSAAHTSVTIVVDRATGINRQESTHKDSVAIGLKARTGGHREIVVVHLPRESHCPSNRDVTVRAITEVSDAEVD
jgi:hypothetical protein